MWRCWNKPAKVAAVIDEAAKKALAARAATSASQP
jgi:hypothetical protein